MTNFQYIALTSIQRKAIVPKPKKHMHSKLTQNDFYVSVKISLT